MVPSSRVVSRNHSIEPLESRIAPALLINGANLLVAGSGTSVGETSVGDNNVELVKVISGSAIVWYDDGDITAISFGPNTSLEITGSVGTLIGNLQSNGRLSDTNSNPADGEDGEVLLANDLIGLKVRPFQGVDAVIGSIITGGSVQNVTIDGRLSGIYAGDGVFHEESARLSSGVVSVNVGFDYNPITPGDDTSFDLTLAAAQQKGLQAGASIKNVKVVKAASLQVFAGSGDPNDTATGSKGAAGGSITNVFIETAFESGTGKSYELRAGDGASAAKGGAGGSISKLVEKSSGSAVEIIAGDGGDGSKKAGGAGGSVRDLDIQSDSAQYIVEAGHGGSGSPGGAGGAVKNTSFANRTPVGGVVLAADFTGDGVDDILVANQGTGEMIIFRNIGDGANFEEIVQYTDEDESKKLITPLPGGETPTDAVAVDFDGDGDNDVVVAYKNSNSIGVFYNQGGGSFWDPALNPVEGGEPEGGFAGFTVGLQLSPTKLATLDAEGGRIAVAGIAGGKGALQLLTRQFGDDGPTLTTAPGINNLKFTVSDIVGSRNGGLFMATSDGKVQQLTISGLEKQPFDIADTGVTVAGGVDDLDFDSDGTRLLVLSTTRKSMTVYQVNSSVGDGILTNPVVVGLSDSPGKPLVAKFIRDGSASEDRIAILNSLSSGARMDIFNPIVVPGSEVATSYVFSRSLNSDQTLNRFVPAYSETGAPGFAALGGSLTDVTFGDDFLQVTDYNLPFAEKSVKATAGNGGNGLDVSKKPGKGGAGGSVIGLNADAALIEVPAGAGGDSVTGAGGAGGSISNKEKFTTVSGVRIAPLLIADQTVLLTAGNGGSPTVDPSGEGKPFASGGAGGGVSDVKIQVDGAAPTGDNSNETAGVKITAGNGGVGRDADAGKGGNISGVISNASGGDLSLQAGNGGSALGSKGAGGAGGSVKGVNHSLELVEEAELREVPSNVTILGGAGGTAIGAAGGAGGNVSDIALKLDGANDTYRDDSAKPPLVDAQEDSTVYTVIAAGAGAAGTTGGLGGSVSGLRYEGVFDQVNPNNSYRFPFYTLSVTAGAGGEGTKRNGGNGGSITLKSPISGVTFFDKNATSVPDDNPDEVALLLTAGAGGKGAAKGGHGGSISGLVAQNALAFNGSVLDRTLLGSAKLTAGDGGEGGSGNGGNGGSVKSSLVGVEAKSGYAFFFNIVTGYLQVTGGAGGDSQSAKGGAGGSLDKSEFGLVSSETNAGMLLLAGGGGTGPLGGGAGGDVSNLKINTSQSTNVPSALIIAGAGGDANSSDGTGGAGGSIKGISQAKDVNSTINLIQAGNGGDNPAGKAGKGGSVSDIRTVGFIGRPSKASGALGVFDSVNLNGLIDMPLDLFHDEGNGTAKFAQGLYVGRGGVGADDNGANGSVSKVVARQIAAIAAAMDPTTQLFSTVSKISKLQADLIGYDEDGDGAFDSTVGTASPETAIPIDGFIFSAIDLSKSKGIAKNLLTEDRKSFRFPA